MHEMDYNSSCYTKDFICAILRNNKKGKESTISKSTKTNRSLIK